eukprot:GHUV01021488.1.p1 GENE.GHUV01021488.1~~GHUV01021488.1.p1  ORF type:complete len:182 (+),score=47.65 GHUV01021488.1:287-832(+)
MGKKRKTHEFEDQFGEYRPQDRDEHCGFSKGSGGGGTAGKSKSSTQLSFQRHVPKFLQPYAHMLGQKRQDEDEPQMLMEQKLRAEQDDDEEDDKAAEEAGADWRIDCYQASDHSTTYTTELAPRSTDHHRMCPMIVRQCTVPLSTGLMSWRVPFQHKPVWRRMGYSTFSICMHPLCAAVCL